LGAAERIFRAGGGFQGSGACCVRGSDSDRLDKTSHNPHSHLRDSTQDSRLSTSKLKVRGAQIYGCGGGVWHDGSVTSLVPGGRAGEVVTLSLQISLAFLPDRGTNCAEGPPYSRVDGLLLANAQEPSWVVAVHVWLECGLGAPQRTATPCIVCVCVCASLHECPMSNQ
jgi:hypothetical protein